MTPIWRQWFPTWEMEALGSETWVLLHRYLQGLDVGAWLSPETGQGFSLPPPASTAEKAKSCLPWYRGGCMVSCLQKELLSEGIKTCFQCTTVIEVLTASPFWRLIRDSDNLTLHKCHSGGNLKGKNLWETWEKNLWENSYCAHCFGINTWAKSFWAPPCHLTATQSYVLKVYGAISSSKAHSGSPHIWELYEIPTVQGPVYTCNLRGLPVMTLTTVRGHQTSTYGERSDRKDQGDHIVPAQRIDLPFVFCILCRIFVFYFIPEKTFKKTTVVVEISTKKFTRNDASVSVHSLWQRRVMWAGKAPLREQFAARLLLSLFQKHRHFLGQKRFLVQKVQGTFCHDNLSHFRNTPDSPATWRVQAHETRRLLEL